MGGIQKRPGRGWVARYYDPSGKQRSKSFPRKIDAERYLTSVEAAKLRGEWIDPALSRITLAEVAGQWRRTIAHMTPSTRLGYESRLRMHVLPVFGEMPLRSITPVVVRQWVAEVQAQGRSRDMTRQAKQVLGAILNMAVEEGYIGKNPAHGVRLGKVAKAEKRFLTDEQVAALASKIQEPYGTWVWFMAYSGLRWGEMAALCRGRCDGRTISVVQSLSEAGGLHFKPTKNYESRTVLLPAAIAELVAVHLDRHVAQGPDAYVFTSPNGELLRNSNFQRRIWKPALEAAGLPWAVRVHDLRHTCAALMVSEGANPKHIQRHLGHSSITVTMDTYGHLFPEDLRYIANRLDQRIGRVWQGTNEGRDRAEGLARRTDADGRMLLTSQNASVGPAGIEPATKGL